MWHDLLMQRFRLKFGGLLMINQASVGDVVFLISLCKNTSETPTFDRAEKI